MSERELPQDRDAEAALIGAVLQNQRIMDEAIEVVKYTDFYAGNLGQIWQVMTKMRVEGRSIDMLSLRSTLVKKNVAKEYHDGAALVSLVEKCYLSDNWREYAEIVRRNSISRDIVRIGTDIKAMGYDSNDDIEATLGNMVSATMGVALAHTNESMHVAMALDTVFADLKHGKQDYLKPPDLPFVRMAKGDVLVLAAGTSVGKTALAMHWADEWSKTRKVTYFEYEMSESELATRLICTHAGVVMEDIQDQNLDDEDWLRMEDAAKELRNRHLRIEEVWCDVGTLLSKIRREAQHGVEVMFIDYLGLIPFNRSTGMNEAKAIGVMVTNRIKRLASELGIRIVLLTQLNREGQKEDFPKLYQLRDSGEIEQDASIVVMAWSDKVLKENVQRKYNIREQCGILYPDEWGSEEFNLIRLGVEKQRNGRLGHKFLIFRGATFEYEDRDAEESIRKERTLFSERQLASGTLPDLQGGGESTVDVSDSTHGTLPTVQGNGTHADGEGGTSDGQSQECPADEGVDRPPALQ